jgi:hypothetical protein
MAAYPLELDLSVAHHIHRLNPAAAFSACFAKQKILYNQSINFIEAKAEIS